MDFNEIMQNIMTFINEHTLLLIGICVFLILVLVGYLIDNSVKSKRIRKDIKNADQVPDNIKKEIIEAAGTNKTVKDTKEEIKENVVEVKNEVQDNVQEVKPTVELDSNNSEVVSNVQNNEIQNDALDASLNLDSSNVNDTNMSEELNLDASLNVQDAQLDNLVGDNNTVFGADVNLTDKQADSLNFNLDSGIIQENVEVDPDAFIMGSVMNQNSEYKNDKSLSEILSENVSVNNEINNSLEEAPLNIEINANVDNNIENTSSNAPQDELEKIMQKLSTMKPDTEEDNYTNIF